MSKITALIGYPLKHSISPIFQQAAFDYYVLEVRYEIWEIESSGLERAIDFLRQPSCLGANVTIPYKEAVIPLLDGLEGLAPNIGAVNTIVKKGSRLIGYNTDAGGFLRSLREKGGFDPKGKKVVMIGAGGVARAIGFMLVRSDVQSLAIFDIDLERTQKLASELKAEGIIVLESDRGAEFKDAVSSAELLVNCTPIGMKHSPSESLSPLAGELISPGSLVYDVVYNPVETPLLKEARSRGAHVVGGLSMLVYQGAEAFELWTGKEAPLDVMLKKAGEALG
ncbi:shikimate dehydrogenase [Chloroflexota bacterium]